METTEAAVPPAEMIRARREKLAKMKREARTAAREDRRREAKDAGFIGEDARERFATKFDRRADDECWPWLAATDSVSGYGKFSIDGITWQAHRVAYQITHGDMDPGLVVDHTCFTRGCVNPAHLRQVTQRENLQNQRATGRTSASGVRGVYWQAGKFAVYVKSGGTIHYGGRFVNIEDATHAAAELRNELLTGNLSDRGV